VIFYGASSVGWPKKQNDDANWLKADFPLEAARLGKRVQTWRCGYRPSLQYVACY
jgi:hypothetical protein